MNFGKRVKRARQLKGYSQKELGNLVGLKQSTISEIESSEESNTNKLIELAEALNVTTDYLNFGDDVPEEFLSTQNPNDDNRNFIWFPLYEVSASAGCGAVVPFMEESNWGFPVPECALKDMGIVDKKSLIAMMVRGDSMIGDLNDGDYIIVDTSVTDPGAGIYVIRLNSDLLVKRISRKPGGIIDVISTNPLFEPFSINLNEMPYDFSIIGKVVWSAGTPK